MRYYVQFGAGFGSLVATALRADLEEVRTTFEDDSAMLFESSSPPDVVSGLSYVKNAFRVLGEVPRGELPAAIRKLTKVIRDRGLLRQVRGGGVFRTMTNIDGALVGVPPQVRTRLETAIVEQTRSKLNARGGTGDEYWVIGRRGLDLLVFCQRLTTVRHRAPARGSLRPDLCALLVKASEPRLDDVFLDPFAGSGALVSARIKLPCRRAIYSDLRLTEHRASLPPPLLKSRKAEIRQDDATVLDSVDDHSITSIVTDPPWGEHEDIGLPFEQFARKMLLSFDRVLHPSRGRLLMLVARRLVPVVARQWDSVGLTPRTTHEILLNGHPATVLVGGR
ncbi:TRM11 family methyltransferase [Amycolatopsis panacis]|uniref:Uncharacterized protein n=1 Tax=Amycolatopsis panacis TaxID=2340917 RepID=A0A419I9R3_9PSEU|nr:hypothetical protein [Amycolatopsis panacis]RJQ89617.1 hypothetical protein D5S19_03925 [Amycolatopsis panacis]